MVRAAGSHGALSLKGFALPPFHHKPTTFRQNPAWAPVFQRGMACCPAACSEQSPRPWWRSGRHLVLFAFVIFLSFCGLSGLPHTSHYLGVRLTSISIVEFSFLEGSDVFLRFFRDVYHLGLLKAGDLPIQRAFECVLSVFYI